MWKLNRIEAENLCAFRLLDYEIAQGVTTLIFGDNRDNDSQRSNGAGKSALLESIAIGLTGSPLRKIRTEEIINDTADECRIQLHLANNAVQESMTIIRRIPRKGASEVSCMLSRDGVPVTTDEAVQPSVDAYNHYILDKLGITREEMLNNFILSKYRYEDFLSSSDKEKKEIINRFSNGIVVDDAIAKVDEDIAPLSERQNCVALELAGLDGRVEMLLEQIRAEEVAGNERNRTHAEHLQELDAAIAVKRELIRSKKEAIESCKNELSEMQNLDSRLQELEMGDNTLDECLSQVAALCLSIENVTPTDWRQVVSRKKEDLQIAEAELGRYDAALLTSADELKQKQQTYRDLKSDYAVFEGQYDAKTEKAKIRLQELDDQMQKLSVRIEELRRQRRSLSAGIDALASRLAGKIACPSCGHEFLIAEPDFDITEGNKTLEQRKRELTSVSHQIADTETSSTDTEREHSALNGSRRALENERIRWEQRLGEMEREVRKSTTAIEDIEHRKERATSNISALQSDIEGIRRKVFDQAYGFIDEHSTMLSRRQRTAEEDIYAAECAIETLQATIHEVNETSENNLILSLKASLAAVRKTAAEVAARKMDADGRVRTLEIQKERFVQFKTYLANSKIEALGRITNEFLHDIGSDIRIRFDGYTLLKSGKVRDKISVSLLRDGVDCGSFGKFSAGEAARVNLATILAMQKLVNANCDEEKGLDLLVLDEILEAVDEAGLASMFEALNALGGTVLIVSHGNVAEGYPHRLVVVKENGESHLQTT